TTAASPSTEPSRIRASPERFVTEQLGAPPRKRSRDFFHCAPRTRLSHRNARGRSIFRKKEGTIALVACEIPHEGRLHLRPPEERSKRWSSAFGEENSGTAHRRTIGKSRRTFHIREQRNPVGSVSHEW